VLDDENVEEQSYSFVRDRLRRKIKPLSRYGHFDFTYCLAVTEDVEFSEPLNYKKAVASSDTAKWRVVMKKKVHSLQKNLTWTLVEQPKDKKVIGCKCVFKKNDDAEGVRYKTRLVAKDYSQVEGVNFNEVFILVVKYTSIRILLSGG
jgi:Reverse transcriptase (RNA-dependent DNA polymerase)